MDSGGSRHLFWARCAGVACALLLFYFLLVLTPSSISLGQWSVLHWNPVPLRLLFKGPVRRSRYAGTSQTSEPSGGARLIGRLLAQAQGGGPRRRGRRRSRSKPDRRNYARRRERTRPRNWVPSSRKCARRRALTWRQPPATSGSSSAAGLPEGSWTSHRYSCTGTGTWLQRCKYLEEVRICQWQLRSCASDCVAHACACAAQHRTV